MRTRILSQGLCVCVRPSLSHALSLSEYLYVRLFVCLILSFCLCICPSVRLFCSVCVFSQSVCVYVRLSVSQSLRLPLVRASLTVATKPKRLCYCTHTQKEKSSKN